MHSEFEPDELLAEIGAARQRLKDVALHTPLLPFRDAYIKAENLQRTGSFKFRGAYSAMATMSAEERDRGVVAHSSGNHAQAVARAARLLGMRAVVVMPNNAPAVKAAGVRADGAEIIFVGPHNQERVAHAHEIAERDGMVLIPSANHPRVIAGQGTIGFEILGDLLQFQPSPRPVIVVPIGLGGLAAGVALAAAGFPGAAVVGVEPTLAADTYESLQRGERVTWRSEDTARTIADGLRGESPAAIAFAILKRHVTGMVTVDEDEIVAAMRVAAQEAKLVLEPSGAAPLAALLFHRDELPEGDVVVVASGGNVDPDRYREWLAAG